MSALENVFVTFPEIERVFNELAYLQVTNMECEHAMQQATNSIKRLISVTSRLETLSIGKLSTVQWCSMTALFKPCQMKQIRCLHLAGMHVTLQGFIDCFRACSATLVEVEIRSVSLTDAKWKTFFNHLRAFPYRELKIFELIICCDSILDWADLSIHDFLLRRTDINPMQPC